jgi:hypothetical protein
VSGHGFLWRERFALGWWPLSYGLLLPFGLYGVAVVSREGTRRGDGLLAWLAAAVFLSVNPVYAGVKFQYLVFPPLCVLAVRGFFALRKRSARFSRLSGRPAAAAAGLALVFLNAPVCFWRDMPLPGVERFAFVNQGDLDAMTWLASRPGGAVLCHPRTGNLMPWLAARKVHAGHWFMSPGYKELDDTLNSFYRKETDLSEKRRILQTLGARYVYRGFLEALVGDVDAELGLTRIYDQDGVAIWEVPAAR